MCGVVFDAVNAFVRCVVIGSLVDVTAQIMLTEGLAKIVVAITAIPVDTLIDATTTVVASIVVPTTVATIVSTLAVFWWVVVT